MSTSTAIRAWYLRSTLSWGDIVVALNARIARAKTLEGRLRLRELRYEAERLAA